MLSLIQLGLQITVIRERFQHFVVVAELLLVMTTQLLTQLAVIVIT
jgi:hypothetical protein